MRRIERIVAGLIAALALCVPLQAQYIASIEFSPTPANTGDPVFLVIRILIAQDCLWKPSASARFGTQPELDPLPGWGIDLFLERTTPACEKPRAPLRFKVDLGTLPVASGPGVVRLTLSDRDGSTELFDDLTVMAGPAPGWRHPVAHGGEPMFMQSAAAAAIDIRVLAIADLARRDIFLYDLLTRDILGEFRTPGTFGLARGLAFDGAHLFVSVADLFGPAIFEIDLDGIIHNTFPSPTISPGNRPLEGLAYHDGTLYGTIESPPTLFAIDPDDGSRLWSRGLPLRILGLTSCPEGLLGVEPTGRVLLIDPSPFGFDMTIGDLFDLGLIGIPSGIELQSLAFDGTQLFAWDAIQSTMRSLRPLALWWAIDLSLQSYVPREARSVDVIRGQVDRMRQLAGNVGLGPTICLVSEGSGGAVEEGEAPPLGEAQFFLARVRGPGGFKTGYGRSSAGFRRIEEPSFPGACP
jgi:hypothetical protein